MIGASKPTTIHIVCSFRQLLCVGPAYSVGGANGGLASAAHPIDVVPGLLPVDTLAENGRALADLKNIYDRAGIQNVFTTANGATGYIALNFNNAFDLGRQLERSRIHCIPSFIDVVCLLFASDRLSSY